MSRTCRLGMIFMFIAASGAEVEPQHRANAETENVSEALQLLKEEVLDNILLEQTVYFITPEGSDAIAAAGMYRVEAEEPSRLRLIANHSEEVVIVEALVTDHQDKIASPVALFIPDDANIPHVVLLLPGGQGLEAVGSYHLVRPRAPLVLSPTQIHDALIRKKEALAKSGLGAEGRPSKKPPQGER